MTNKSGNKILKLADQFRAMEVKHNLFKLQTTDGIYCWDILRLYVYFNLLAKKGIFPSNMGLFIPQKESKFKKILKAIRILPLLLINELQYFLLCNRNSKYVFLFVSRFQDKNGNPEDSLMKDIYNQLEKDSFVMESFRHKNFNWLKGNTGQRYFLYKLELYFLIGKNQNDDWSNLSKIINTEFEVEFNWEKVFQPYMNKHRKEYAFFSNLFKKIKPKYLFFQYHPRGMVAAANDLNITTIDVQHGITNNTVVAYFYPKSLNLDHVNTIPRILLTLGEFWNRQINFPFQTETMGNNFYFVKQDHDVSKRKGIMVVSSAISHEEFKKGTADLAKQHPDLQFYYKLHSGQQHQVESSRVYFKSLVNVDVIFTEKNVDQIMADCFAIILIQSTVAYQALQKGLQVFILKQQYFEISYEIFEMDGVQLVNDWVEISSRLSNKQFNTNSFKAPVFFEPYDPSKLNYLINKTNEINL